MNRPLFDAEIEDLEKIVREKSYSRTQLAEIREELGFRESARARRLLRDVVALLGGEIPMPKKPAPPPSPEDQIDLL